MGSIEVEVRSFISKEQYEELLSFFKKNARFICEGEQETHYLNAKVDLRIQKTKYFSKIWVKKGKLHDHCREEIEIKFRREDFEKIKELASLLGFETEIVWLRKRKEFEWQGIKVCLDYTKGYGYIIELEKVCDEQEKEKVLDFLKQKMEELGIEITPREEFEKKFSFYKENWRKLIGDYESKAIVERRA